MKKLTIFLILTLFSAAPVFALKVVDNYILTAQSPYRVELRKVRNATYIAVKIGRTITDLRLSDIVCDEYSKYNIKESSAGRKYAIEDNGAQKKNNDATRYMQLLLEQNTNKLYYQQHGIGFYGAIVGELYIGQKNINKLLVEKGYCRPIE